MLLSMSDADLIEEYIEGGDIYRALASGGDVVLAYEAGCITGKLHQAGYTFVDNKAQNYLARGESVMKRLGDFTVPVQVHYTCKERPYVHAF